MGFRFIGVGLTLAGLFLVESPAAATIPATGLIGHWAADGNASDSSATGNGGSFAGTYVSGKYGQAFDLATGSVTIPDITAYGSLGSNFSVGFWFNFNGFNGSWDIVGQDEGAGPHPKWFIDYNYITPGAFELHVNGASSVFIPSNPESPSGWNQLTVTKDGEIYNFYLNGANIGSTAFSGEFPDPAAPLQFSFADGGNPYPGLLDEVVLYDRALDVSEVRGLAGVASVPEPAGWMLLIAGFGILGAVARRFPRERDSAQA